MPELPEVETVRLGMVEAIQSKVIKSVVVNRYDLRVPVPQDFGQSLTGRLVKALRRRGKYIIMDLGGDITAILHLGMSGRIHIYHPHQTYEPKKHNHVVVAMADGTQFSFEDPRRFGMFYLTSKQWETEKPFVEMGPEPLEKWSGDDFYFATRKSSAPTKSVLLDQKYVAGLGNIYVCEALFHARVHPMRQAKTLTKEEAHRIVACSKDVLLRAIEAGGSSLRDYQHTDGSLGYFQHGFSVYNREGAACCNKSCEDTVARIVQSGRSTFYCPSCQHQTQE